MAEDNTGAGCDVSAPPDVTDSFPSEEENECKICYNCFDLDRHTPKVLDCSHTFCRQCLDALHSQEGGGWRVGCPVCQHQTPVPEHEPADPSNTEVVQTGTAVCSATPQESNNSSSSSDSCQTCRQVAFVTGCVLILLSLLTMVGVLYVGFTLYNSQSMAAIYAPLCWLFAGVLALISLALLTCVIWLWKDLS